MYAIEQSDLNQKSFYLGNPLVKRDGVKEEWTLEKIQEYKRCSEDPVYFIEKYMKIITLDDGLISFKLWDFQKNLIEHINENRFSIILAARQSSKSTTMVAYMLWYALFNSDQTIVLLSNKGENSRQLFGRMILALENTPFFLQPGTKVLNKGSVEFANNTKIYARATSSTSIRGMSCNLIALDEFAFVERAEEFFTSSYPVISSGKKSRVIIVSTPNGQNLFYKLWTGAITGTNEFKSFTINWSDVPGRDEKFKELTRKNIGDKAWEQEYELSFHTNGDTLIDANKLLTLSAQVPIHALENETVRVFRQPVKDHSYIMSVDVSRGRGQDYSTFNVIDISTTPFEQVCVFQDNSISPLIFPNKIYKYATLYNEAFVVVESNDNGVLVANSLFYDLEYDNQFTEMRGGRLDVGAEMTKSVKSIGCSNLKDLIEEHKLVLHDRNTIQEVCTFVARGRSFEAETGTHDDLVMNLVLFAWFSSNRHFRALTDIDIKQQLYEERIREMEEELLPFGIIDNGNSYASAIYENESFGGAVWQRI